MNDANYFAFVFPWTEFMTFINELHFVFPLKLENVERLIGGSKRRRGGRELVCDEALLIITFLHVILILFYFGSDPFLNLIIGKNKIWWWNKNSYQKMMQIVSVL